MNIPKNPALSKRKSKINKLTKEIKDVEIGKEQVVDMVEVKNGRKPSLKQDKKELFRE